MTYDFLRVILKKSKVKKRFFMKIFKSTAFWIVNFLLIIALSVVVIYVLQDIDGKTAEVYVKDELYMEIPLSKDGIYEVKTEHGENVIEVKNGRIRVKSADCKNQICVENGWVSKSGKPIICAPHKLSIVITWEKSTTDI